MKTWDEARHPRNVVGEFSVRDRGFGATTDLVDIDAMFERNIRADISEWQEDNPPVPAPVFEEVVIPEDRLARMRERRARRAAEAKGEKFVPDRSNELATIDPETATDQEILDAYGVGSYDEAVVLKTLNLRAGLNFKRSRDSLAQHFDSHEDLVNAATSEFLTTWRNTQSRFVERVRGANGRRMVDGESRLVDDEGVIAPGGILTSAAPNINTIVDNVARQAITGTDQSVNRNAYRMWSERVEEEGRRGPVSAARRDEIADEIRMGFAATRRPTIGFHSIQQIKRGTLSLDAGGDEDSPGIDIAAPSFTGSSSPMEAGTTFSTFDHGAAEALAGGDKSMIKRQLWSILRRETGASQVKSGDEQFSTTSATAHRKAIADVGGVAEAWRQWSDETASDRTVRALFAPFSDAGTYEDQRKIMQTIMFVPGREDETWDAAILAATAPRTRTKVSA
jgi:hypothetical protein